MSLRRLPAWWRLGSPDRWTLLWFVLALPMCSLLLRSFGAIRTRKLLEQASRQAARVPVDRHDLEHAQRLAWLAEVAGRRGLVAASCLRQSLLLYWLLRRRGFAPELKLGVARWQGRFDAHAWVELGGVALGQAEILHTPMQGWNLPAQFGPG